MDKAYKTNSLSLFGAIAMGTGVMIGAGIFALTGQIAELAGNAFVWVFVAAAVATGFSAYSYVKLANAFPSAGGIAMFLEKAYGRTAITASAGLLMAFSMVINESLVARTFGTYTAQLFGWQASPIIIPALGVGLILAAFAVNLLGNRVVSFFSVFLALVKVIGIAALAFAGFWAAQGLTVEPSRTPYEPSVLGFLAALALGVLAFKGFTTITNSGGEIKDPHRNVGRAIILAILACVVVYIFVALAVGASLPIDAIVDAKDFALAEAARPTFGDTGRLVTILLAMLATASGLVASVFAVSRMLGMLTDMQLIPHRHFGMPGRIQTHMLVYTITLAAVMTILFDLSRIAALGAMLYLVMDLAVHWGVLRHLRTGVQASLPVVLTALVIDLAVLAGLVATKLQHDPIIVMVAVAIMVGVFVLERVFLRRRDFDDPDDHAQHSH
ncbi:MULTISPECIES: APC family permease [Alphaproteobacteria]|jgi:amino acid transporter|uniref:Amino acid permease n=1 Tax=Maricaulis virginensis TaxID=144022 RepID=A0A9W6MPC8_9PROT|nr:APC family permease [Maricaulis virginensis]GLK53485.1 amino acid permease [Maricaulis virginensis]